MQSWTRALGLTLLCAAAGNAEVYSRGVDSEIKNLPGLDKLPPLNFKMYSGYLNASAKHAIHYWFVESQNAPAYDPVLLWLNGGPGCSSLGGFLEELGPFFVQDDLSLKLNPWSWNKEANVLFLESPAGVGFSYSADFEISTDDDTTATHNYNALKDFFFQFPQFARHEFYVSGESYAGVYLPTLVERIIDNNAELPDEERIQLKGMAIGNGLLSNPLNTDTTMEFAYSHGLVDEETWQKMTELCCEGQESECAFHSTDNLWCEYQTNLTQIKVWLGGLNPYDMYRNCWHNPNVGKKTVSTKWTVNILWMAPLSVRDAALTDSDLDDDQNVIISDPTCSNETAVTLYLNQPAVRDALNIPYHVGYWTDCKAGVKWSYTKQYDDLSPQVNKALDNGIRTLVYNGDTDMVCNWLMGQRFTHQLGHKLKYSKRPWKYGDGQIGGFVTQYEDDLDFVTIKGAGHMAPGWRPEQNYKVLQSFLKQQPY